MQHQSKGSEMVELAREEPKITQAETDMKHFNRQCDMYGMKNVVRIDVYPRLIDEYDTQAEYLERLAQAMREAKKRRLALAKITPTELARIASVTETEMHMTHTLMRQDFGQKPDKR